MKTEKKSVSSPDCKLRPAPGRTGGGYDNELGGYKKNVCQIRKMS